MEKVKETLGLNPSSQSGTEPVSGETGSGTSGDPYDQGNADGNTSPPYKFPQLSLLVEHRGIGSNNRRMREKRIAMSDASFRFGDFEADALVWQGNQAPRRMRWRVGVQAG